MDQGAWVLVGVFVAAVSTGVWQAWQWRRELAERRRTERREAYVELLNAVSVASNEFMWLTEFDQTGRATSWEQAAPARDSFVRAVHQQNVISLVGTDNAWLAAQDLVSTLDRYRVGRADEDDLASAESAFLAVAHVALAARRWPRPRTRRVIRRIRRKSASRAADLTERLRGRA